MKEHEPIRFCVNGKERDLPLSGDSSFGDLIQFVRDAYSNDSSCIASIRIDGKELTEVEERDYERLPVSELREVEVFTTHPRELAEETLQDLLLFIPHLENLCMISASNFRNTKKPSPEFIKLMDGIETFTDAVAGVRQILRVSRMQSIDILEADMLEIMKDLLDYYQQEQIGYVVELLQEHLPQNLTEWREQGIPALIRSRDS